MSCYLCNDVSFVCVANKMFFIKMAKYLNVVMKNTSIALICRSCIDAIENFHEFYEKVHNALSLKENVVKASLPSQKNENPSLKQSGKFDKYNVFEEIKVEELSQENINENTCSLERSGKFDENKIEELIPSQDAENMNESLEQMESSGEQNVNNVEELIQGNNKEDSWNGFGKSNKFYTEEQIQTPAENRARRLKQVAPSFRRVKTTFTRGEFTLQLRARRLAAVNKFYVNILCPLCDNGVVHPNIKQLNLHFEQSHAGTRSFLKCCGNSIYLYSGMDILLWKHLQVHNDCYRCEICDKILSSLTDLELHHKLHVVDDAKVLECGKCGFACATSYRLKRHIRDAHSNEEDIICYLCGKTFPDSETSLVHMKDTHPSKVQLYQCLLCPKSFKYEASLCKHRKTGHSNFRHAPPKKKPCPECGKCMIAHSLKLHMIKAHGEGRPHECPLCPKSYKGLLELRTHLVSWHGDGKAKSKEKIFPEERKPFPCAQCDRSYLSKNALSLHIASWHGEGRAKSKEEIFPEKERPFRCAQCDRSYLSKTALNVHQAVHTEPVSCPHCGKDCNNQSSLYFHLRGMHATEHNNRKSNIRRKHAI